MTINEIKKHLKEAPSIAFELPNGQLVPNHFHVTEVGLITKDFIDCGGTVRHEKVASFQLWEADDYDHRLHPEKLINIINLSQDKLGIGDFEIEVEYQGETIGKYALGHNGSHFVLKAKKTDCLAKDNCGIPQKPKFNLADLTAENSGCTPGSGCC